MPTLNRRHSDPVEGDIILDCLARRHQTALVWETDAPFAVRQLGGDNSYPAAAHRHALDRRLEAGDNLVPPDLEDETLAAGLLGVVKHDAGLEVGDEVDDDEVAVGGRGPRAGDEVCDGYAGGAREVRLLLRRGGRGRGRGRRLRRQPRVVVDFAVGARGEGEGGEAR